MKKYAVLCVMVLLLGPAFLGTAKADDDTTTENGFTWDANGVLTEYSGTETEVVIPSNITAIGYAVFAGRSIKKVTIPASVVSIADYAFVSCTNLESVIFADISNSNLTTIGNVVFQGCSSLKSLVFPDSVTDMGLYSFQSCSSLESVSLSKNLKTFDINSFQYCSALTELTIPNCVTIIEDYCFSGCDSLTTLIIPDSVTTIRPYSLSSSTRIPALETVYIGAGVSVIGDGAFQGCRNLKSVTFAETGADCTLGSYCFSDCTALETIALPGRVKSLGDSCFYNNSSLKSVTFGEGLETIGYYAFQNDSTLKEITIPKTVTSIGYQAFAYCSGLESVIFEEGVTGAENYCFCGCTALQELYIPGSMKVIGYGMFSGCSKLKKLTVAEGVESIGSGAFLSCWDLGTVTIPSTLTNFSKDIFSYNSGIKNIYVTEGTGTLKGTKNGDVVMDGTKLLWLVSSDTPIPAEADTIGTSVFQGDDRLTNLVLPENIKYIDPYAFSTCANLESISLPSGLLGIGEYAFYYCTKLDHLMIPAAVSSIGTGIFRGCVNLRNVSVADENPYYSYAGNALVELNTATLIWGNLATEIPGTVQVIGQYAFDEQDTHYSLILPEGVTTIMDDAFMNCPVLQTVILPDTVSTVGQVAFSQCPELQYVSLSAGMKKLDGLIISGSKKLKRVFIPESITEIQGNFIYDYDQNNFKLIVYPNSAAEQYAKNQKMKYEYVYEGNDEITFKGYSLSLAENFNLYVYTSYGAFDTFIPNGISARVTYPDGRVLCNVQLNSEWNYWRNDAEKGTIIPFQVSFAAKELNDSVIVQMFQNGTNIAVSEPITLSVVGYCNELCSQENTTDAEKALAQKMLAYGTYSQLYFGYRTDNLAKPVSECVLSDAEDVVESISDYRSEPLFDGGAFEEGVAFYGSSLILDSTLDYRMYFKSEYWMTSQYGLSEEPKNGFFYKDVPVAIADFGNNLSFRMYDVNVTANPMSYVKNVLNDEGNPESLKNLCIALYDYYTAAKAYQQQ